MVCLNALRLCTNLKPQLPEGKRNEGQNIHAEQNTPIDDCDSTARVDNLIENYDSNWMRDRRKDVVCSCIGEIHRAWRSHYFF